MKKLLILLTKKHSVILLLSTILLLDVLLIFNLFAPTLLRFIFDHHIYEIIVLTALFEALLLLTAKFWKDHAVLYNNNEEVSNKLFELLESDKSIKQIKILSAGMGSTGNFISSILLNYPKIKIRVVSGFGQSNPDELDRINLGPVTFERITRNLDQRQQAQIEIRQNLNTPSLKCILLCDENLPLYGFVGWYTYYGKNSRIVGRRNAQLFADRHSSFGASLLHFIDKKFALYNSAEESEPLYPSSG